MYAVTASDRTRPVYELLAAALFEAAGIRLNEGKTRTWNRAGLRPPDMESLGEEVWCPAGVQALGTPVGTDDFVEALVAERLLDEQRLWQAIPEVPDLQCAWQLLVQCVGPRANHFLRTVPPSQSASYARRHDEGLWRAVDSLLGTLPGSTEELRRRSLQHCRSAWAVWVSGLQNARLQLRTGPRGLMLWQCLMPACRPWPRLQLLLLLGTVALHTRQVASQRLVLLQTSCEKASFRNPHGASCAVVFGHAGTKAPSQVSLLTAGSTLLPLLENTTFEGPRTVRVRTR